MTGGRPPLPSGRSDGEFVRWNEAMVRRYPIERYYAEASTPVRWIEGLRVRAVQRYADPSPDERVLEVGCGAGHVLEGFGEGRCVGADLSPTMLTRARERLDAGTDLVRAFAERLPFAGGAFDVVVCTEVLEHTVDPGSILRELVRVTASEGRIVVSVPNERIIDGVKRILGHIPGCRGLFTHTAEEGNPWHLHRMDLGMLRRLASRVVRVERVRRIPVALLPIRYVVVLRPRKGTEVS